MVESEDLKEIIETGQGMARFLKEQCVEHVFGIPDGHTLAFYDGILKTEGIDHILFNDERSAADAYARITGNIGVCDAGSAGSMNFPVALSEAKIITERYEQNLRALRHPYHHIKPTLPMPSGGITPGMVEKCIKEAGNDILIGSGGGIHSHPDGPISGAKAFRQAIDAVMEGKNVRDVAKEKEELGKAMGVWGSGKTKLIE